MKGLISKKKKNISIRDYEEEKSQTDHTIKSIIIKKNKLNINLKEKEEVEEEKEEENIYQML